MEVKFTVEEEARLHLAATRAGKPVSSVIHDVVSRAIQDETAFIEAVERGMASAARGDLLDHDDVVARIERRFSQ